MQVPWSAFLPWRELGGIFSLAAVIASALASLRDLFILPPLPALLLLSLLYWFLFGSLLFFTPLLPDSIREAIREKVNSLRNPAVGCNDGAASCTWRRHMPHKIMVVDDEADLIQLLVHHLRREGYEPLSASSGVEALERIKRQRVSLVILDLILPGEDGLQICKQLRSLPETASLPIIILTAKDQESDKIVGLELGADDYMTKPFSPRELVARVKSLLRRLERAEKVTRYVYGDLILDLARHEVNIAGKKVVLTAKEFSLLQHFLKNKGKVLTREQILNDLWGIDFFGTGRTVDVHIRRLREKIPILSDAIETIPSIGYKLADDPSAP